MRKNTRGTRTLQAGKLVALAGVLSALAGWAGPSTALAQSPEVTLEASTVSSELKSAIFAAVLQDLPNDFQDRSMAADPRWAPLPGDEEEEALHETLLQGDSLSVRHGEAIDPQVFEGIRAMGLTLSVCEQGLGTECILDGESAHFTFSEPEVAAGQATIQVLMSARLAPDERLWYFNVWSYELDVGDRSVTVTERSRIMTGHGPVPAEG
ncbi:MAG: hypothetical protein EA352_02345 [Gemmatimonadales bacterium]|nr:MAG: hypothetical protein EA352_02345 [Gemmatimonadales bacterium]